MDHFSTAPPRKVGRTYYQYYDTPEGCNIKDKMIVTTRYAAVPGLIFSTYDILMYSHASKIVDVLKRYAMHTVPFVLMAATFTGVSNGLVLTRQKNDALNYFAGGFACGPILAWYLGSKHAVLLGGLALGVAAVIKKTAIDSGTTLFPEPHSHMKTVWSWRRDYTLAKDPLIEEKLTCDKHPSCAVKKP